MVRFASNTTVSVEHSQEQIKRTLRRYGANGFGISELDDVGAVMFVVNGLTVRIDVPLPLRDDAEFTVSPSGRERKTDAAYKAYEQAIKQRWRALLLAIKAKLEAVETGISTLETEFMPFVVCPDGKTVGEHLMPRLLEVAKTGKMPKLLGMPG